VGEDVGHPDRGANDLGGVANCELRPFDFAARRPRSTRPESRHEMRLRVIAESMPTAHDFVQQRGVSSGSGPSSIVSHTSRRGVLKFVTTGPNQAQFASVAERTNAAHAG
jgi:hypothetical protein